MSAVSSAQNNTNENIKAENQIAPNVFTAENLNLENLTIDDTTIEKNQGKLKFHFKLKGAKKSGFWYQLKGNELGEVLLPFGFSNYQNSGNISAEMNIQDGSPDCIVLSKLFEVLSTFLENRPDIRQQYLDEAPGESWDRNAFRKYMIKKQLIHYPKTGKGQYDPSITVSIPFGYKKGDKGPVIGTDGKPAYVDTRVKVPYFTMTDIDENVIADMSVNNVTSIVPHRSKLMYVVLRFDRITCTDGKFNINVELRYARKLPNESIQVSKFLKNDVSENHMQRIKETLHTNYNQKESASNTYNPYNNDNVTFPNGDGDDDVITAD